MTETPQQVVARLWDALYRRDWDAVAAVFDDDSVYWDVPTGPTTAARGPKAIVGRLQLGLADLAGYEHSHGAVVTDAEGTVMTEHAETWHWPSGETVTLPFVSVQKVRDGRIAVWRDYWDYNTLASAAPAAWHDRLANADLWWLYDATGID